MAVLKYSKALQLDRFLDFDKISEDTVRLSKTELSGELYGYEITLKGVFEYWVWDPYYKDDKGVDGKVRSITLEQSGKTALSVTGLNQDFMNLDHATARFGVDDGIRLLLLGNDTIDGSAARDVLDGHAGHDVLRGNGGHDALGGGVGNDQLIGGAGNDALSGAAGNDRLVGGAGTDRLAGGAGVDHFVFQKVADSAGYKTRDVISDFSAADVIDLRTIDADTARAGNQGFRFIDGREFSDRAGELRDEDGVLHGDVNGDGRADFFIQVLRASGARVDLVWDDILC